MLWFLLVAQGGAIPPIFNPAAAPNAPTAAPPQIVVTGSRVATAPDDIAANVTVLERADFDVEKPAMLADVLRRVAGLHVDSVGGRGGTGSVYVRGADPNYTLVLVDGVRVNDPTNARGGSFDFSTLDVADVERVEIARGPYSAIYGGDALAGVIHIVTRRGREQSSHASIDLMGGAYDTRALSVRTGGPAADGSWSMGFSRSNEGEQVRGNDYSASRLSGGFDTDLGANTSFSLTGRYAETDRAGFPDDSGGHGFAALRTPERRAAHEVLFGAGLDHRAGDATFSVSIGYFDRSERIDSPGVAPGVRDPFGVPPSLVDAGVERFSATLTGTQKFSDAMTLAYGVDWQRESGTSDGSLDFGIFQVPTSFALTRTSWAPFAELRLATEFGLSAQAGVRLDQYDDGIDGGDGSVTSPRLRVAYQFADSGITLAGAWGKAFKLPSLYALGHPLVGNPDLVPERGQSHEIELSQTLADGAARWSVTWFEGEFRNAVDFDPGPPPMLVNRNRIDSDGFEFSGSLILGGAWALDGSVTHTRNRVAATGGELRNRPEWRGGIAAHWTPTTDLRFSASATHVGSSLDSSIATGDVRVGAYTRIDLSASWQLTDHLETYLAVDNATDEQYEQFVGFESRGILPRLGIKYSL